MPHKHPAPAIGGYFELERAARQTPIPAQALRYQSARAALRALLESGRPTALCLPHYICNVVVQAAQDVGIALRFYSLASNLGVPQHVAPRPGEWLLYVNYFGLCDDHSQALLSRVDPGQVILDHAQAYFSPPADCLATVYSPRKFFGLPDGGLLYTRLPVCVPHLQDESSVDRTQHLVKRAAFDAEQGYADFQAAEAQLSDTRPRAMSQLTQRLLEGADQERSRVVRRRNFHQLHEALGERNAMPLNLDTAEAPLCYPFLSREHGLREKLIAARVFVARYWPDALPRLSNDCVEAELAEYCLPLPIDQRYGEEAMQRMITLLT